MLVSVVSVVSFRPSRSFRSFRWFCFARFGGFVSAVSLFRVLVHADVESYPFPTNSYYKSVPFISPTNSVSLLKFRLSQLSKTAVDAGGGGDCIFGAVSRQLYGNPKNHFFVHSDGIQ